MTNEPKKPSESSAGSCPVDSEISAALVKVKGSRPFAQSDRLSNFLTYIVEETLAGRGDKIIGYSIGVDVYGKPQSFDPNTDAVVRVEAGRLRRSLDQYYRGAGAEDVVEIVVPKGTYVPEFRYRGDDRVITAQVSPPYRVGTAEETRNGNDRGPSIAVLPFENYGADPADQFFVDGLTEETIANLARFKDLFVFSRTTTTKLSQEGADIQQMRDQLNVDFVVEGSVRKTTQLVRVTFQLIDATTDGHILAESIDRDCTPEGVFEIQDEIATLVAGRIADRHGPLGRYVSRGGSSGQSRRWATYNLITRFYDYYATHQPERHAEVRDGLEQALDQDQDSSDGHAALSIVLLDEYRLHINERPNYPALSQALSHAHVAVSSDPENAFAHKALALAYFHSHQFTDFRVSAERAVELNPGNASVLADLGHSHWFLGDRERGLELLDRALSLSPIHPGWYHHARACDMAIAGRAEEAMLEIKQVPMVGFIWYHAFLAWFYAEFGDLKSAANEVNDLLAVCPNFCSIVEGEFTIWCVHDAVRNAAVTGWRKAGLTIEE